MIKYGEMIKENDKYHYFMVNNKKSVKLASDNSNTKAKQKVLEKLSKNINKYIDKKIVRVKIIKSNKIDLDKKLIGGPLVLKLETYKIISEKKLKKVEQMNNYFFYKSNEKIDKNDLKKISFIFYNKKYNMGAFKVKYVKKLI